MVTWSHNHNLSLKAVATTELKEKIDWVPLTPAKQPLGEANLSLKAVAMTELKEKSDWVPLTPAKPPLGEFSFTSKVSVDHDVGPSKNPQLPQVCAELELAIGDSGNGNCEFGRVDEVAGQCGGSLSKTESLGLHGNSEGSVGGISENSPCEFGKGSSVRKQQNLRKRDNTGSGVDQDKKPRQRQKMKRHRPKVYDETKPVKSRIIKPSTPKPRTPKRPSRSIKKTVSLKRPVHLSKNDNQDPVDENNKLCCGQKLEFDLGNCRVRQNSEARDEENENKRDLEPKMDSGNRFSILKVYQRRFKPDDNNKQSCRQKLDFSLENWIVNQSPKAPDEAEEIRPDLEPKVNSSSRFNFLQVYQRRFKPNECLKNSRMLGPNCPKICKRTRMRRERATVFATKFIFTEMPNEWKWILRRKRSTISTRRQDFSSLIIDPPEFPVSGRCIEHQELPQNSEVLSSENTQKSSEECGDCSEHQELPQDRAVPCNKNTLKSLKECGNCLKHQELPQETESFSDYIQYDAFTEALIKFATQKMESLHINDVCNELVVRELNTNGEVVPSRGKFDPSKIHKTLPKVDLDPETMIAWNQLMENGGSGHFEPEDDDKAKYWKEQRELFSKRIETFISRMELVQGNRSFSPWKGSVVDSVVGVFLTQNVSDNLSSSAFMSLAARFPPPPVNEHTGVDGISECVIHENDTLEVHVEIPEPTPQMENNPSSSLSDGDGLELKNENKPSTQTNSTFVGKKGNIRDKQVNTINWDDLRKKYCRPKNRTDHTADSVNWEAVRKAPVEELAKVIVERGMNNILAGRIKDFLNRLVKDHGSIDLEWLRDVPEDKAKEYLLSIPGIGLKSVECVRLLGLHHHAFPVDTNVCRIAVRLGWVPLQPLPENVEFHLLNQFPVLDSIQKYLWPRISHLGQLILYNSHCHFITCGKVFCTKIRPNCNACPMKVDCKYYASYFASSKLPLEGAQGENPTNESSKAPDQDPLSNTSPLMLSNADGDGSQTVCNSSQCEPIIEIPASPEPNPDGDGAETANSSSQCEPIIEIPASPEPAPVESPERDVEDFFRYESEDEIPTIKLNAGEFRENVPSFMKEKGLLNGEDDVSKALVTLSPEAASIPMPKLKSVGRLRTAHHVFELPDSHPLLARLEKRLPGDPSPYLLAIWATSDETTNSSGKECLTPSDMGACCSSDIVQYQNDQIVKGTILIPCRTALRGAFPLNGTYFQINEVFADHESSQNPISVPREWIWDLRRRALYCGTSTTSICRGFSLENIHCFFLGGFMCIRGMDRDTRAPRPLARRFHFCKTRALDDE